MLPIRQSRTAGSEVTKEKEQYNAFIVQHVIRHLQFVHQVVAQVLRDVLVPVLPHTKGRGRLGCGHRTHASRVIHQPVVKGGREKKKGKDEEEDLNIECNQNLCINVEDKMWFDSSNGA